MQKNKMFHVTMLGSGSAGNATLVCAGQTRLLVDAGLSGRQIQTRLAAHGYCLEQLDGILLTHEHQDHAGALGILSRKIPIPIYCNRLTAESLTHLFPGQSLATRIFQTGSTVQVKEVEVESFPVPHDAVEPVGFRIRFASQSVAFLTDLGHATLATMERVRGAHTLVIETNHDERLLQECTKRPWSVKQRILSRHGHLSNLAAARVLAELSGWGLKHAILCHLSRDCNQADLAMETVRNHFVEVGAAELPSLYCASQTEPTPLFTIPLGLPKIEQHEFAFL